MKKKIKTELRQKNFTIAMFVISMGVFLYLFFLLFIESNKRFEYLQNSQLILIIIYGFLIFFSLRYFAYKRIRIEWDKKYKNILIPILLLITASMVLLSYYSFLYLPQFWEKIVGVTYAIAVSRPERSESATGATIRSKSCLGVYRSEIISCTLFIYSF